MNGCCGNNSIIRQKKLIERVPVITESLLYGITSEDFVIKTYVIHWDTESSGVWSTLHVG